VAYKLSGRVRNVDLRRLPPQLRIPKLESRVAGTYTATGVGSRIDGTLAFDASVIEGMRIDAGSRGRVSFSAPVPAYGFDGRVADVDLRRIGRAMNIRGLDQVRFASRLSGTVTLDGSGADLTALRLDADTTLEPSELFDTTLMSASIRTHIEERTLTASARGEFASLDLGTFTGREQLRGELAGAFDVRSAMVSLGQPITLDTVSGDGTVRLEASTLGPIAIDTAVLEGQYANRGGEIRSLHVVGPQLEVTANGPIALGDHGESNLEYHIVHGRLEELMTLVGRDVAGRLSLDGTITGNGAHLASTGTSTLAPFRVDTTFDALEVTSAFEASIANYRRDSVRVTADIDSVLPTIAGRSLRSLNADVGYANAELEFQSTVMETGRTATVMGRLVTLEDGREVRVEQFAVEAAGVAWSNSAGHPFTARYGTNGLLTIKDLELTSGNQRLVAAGSVSLDPDVEGSLDVHFEQVEMADLGALLLEPRVLGGILNGTGQVAGDSGNRRISGKVSVANGLVEGFRFESLDASVRLAESRLSVDALLRQAPGAELTVRGELATSAEGTSGDEPLSLDVKTKGIDLALLDAVSDVTEGAAGRLLVDLHVTGTAAAPRLAGSLNVQNGIFTVATTGMQYSSATLDVLFEGDQLRINTLSLLDENGERLDGSGTLGIEGRRVQAVDLTLRANEFKILGNELGELSVDTTLNVYGTVLAPKIAGLVRVHAGRLEVDALVDRFTSNAYALPPVETKSEASAAADRTGPTLDLTVQVPGNLILRGRDIRPADSAVALGDLNVTVGGDFSLRQVAGGEPVLLGTVTAVRGTYGFQGRRFDVLRDGIIAFRGERPIDPSLDLQAERVVSGIVAHVNIGGTMRSPSLVLSSRPPLEEADILSLILFNEPVNRLGSGQRDALGERAVGLASGFVVSPISDTLEHALDVDLFELEAVTEGGGPAITLGEQVGERLFVRVRQTFGAQDTTEFRLEYQLAEFLRLQGSFSEGKGRADRTLTRRVERSGIDLVVFFSY
jgi:translocation and assembly module TamB